MHEEIVSPQAGYIRDGTIDFQDQMTWFKEEVLAEKRFSQNDCWNWEK